MFYSVLYFSLNIQHYYTAEPKWLVNISTVTNALALIMAIYLHFSPDRWPVWVLFHTTQGLKASLWGNDVLSLFLYAFGWVIAYRVGFFDSARKRKLGAIAAGFFLIFAYQLHTGFVDFILDLGRVLFVTAGIIVVFILFSQNKVLQKALYENTEKESVDLSQMALDTHEFYYIYGIMHGIPYKIIADRLNISESVVKRDSLRLFKKFNVAHRAEFHEYLICRNIIFPKNFNTADFSDYKNNTD